MAEGDQDYHDVANLRMTLESLEQEFTHVPILRDGHLAYAEKAIKIVERAISQRFRPNTERSWWANNLVQALKGSKQCPTGEPLTQKMEAYVKSVVESARTLSRWLYDLEASNICLAGAWLSRPTLSTVDSRGPDGEDLDGNSSTSAAGHQEQPAKAHLMRSIVAP